MRNLILGSRLGALSKIVYVAIGLSGVPVIRKSGYIE
ncbi:biotin transporter BioY [Clostridium lacusfryxellense]